VGACPATVVDVVVVLVAAKLAGGRYMPSLTAVPLLPRSLATTWSRVMPATGAPSTDTMMSPGWMPASAAGLPLNTWLVVMKPFCTSSAIPRPV
jgi:hypothetical protein